MSYGRWNLFFSILGLGIGLSPALSDASALDHNFSQPQSHGDPSSLEAVGDPKLVTTPQQSVLDQTFQGSAFPDGLDRQALLEACLNSRRAGVMHPIETFKNSLKNSSSELEDAEADHYKGETTQTGDAILDRATAAANQAKENALGAGSSPEGLIGDATQNSPSAQNAQIDRMSGIREECDKIVKQRLALEKEQREAAARSQDYQNQSFENTGGAFDGSVNRNSYSGSCSSEEQKAAQVAMVDALYNDPRVFSQSSVSGLVNQFHSMSSAAQQEITSLCPQAPYSPEGLGVFFTTMLLSMAAGESGNCPETQYTESFNDGQGKNVVSRGMLQLSPESGNGHGGLCQGVTASSLHDPAVNARCGLQIMHSQLLGKNSQNRKLLQGPKSYYWSVLNKSNQSGFQKVITRFNDLYESCPQVQQACGAPPSINVNGGGRNTFCPFGSPSNGGDSFT